MAYTKRSLILCALYGRRLYYKEANEVKHRLFGWVLAIGLLVLTVLALMAVEGRGQDLDHRVYLPVVAKEYGAGPPRPWLTPTPTKTAVPPSPTPIATPSQCVLYMETKVGSLTYSVFRSGFSSKYVDDWGARLYGSFPAGTYSWQADAHCYGGRVGAWGTDYFGVGDWEHVFKCDWATYPFEPPRLVLCDRLRER